MAECIQVISPLPHHQELSELFLQGDTGLVLELFP